MSEEAGVTPVHGPEFAPQTLRSRGGAIATVCAYGAHVLGWRPRQAIRDLLYLSGRSVFGAGAAIRGGIPVVFPQFSGFGPLPKHGFARNRIWRLIDTVDPARAAFELCDDASTRALWPHAFLARLDIALGDDDLATTLSVTNTGGTDFSFTAALHTYLAVQDIATVGLHGLCHHPCLDATQDLAEMVEQRELILFDGEFDRVYKAVAGELVVVDGNERISVTRAGFADAVVWNPGAAKAAALSDLDDGGERRFLCVEPAVFDPPVRLAPGASWRGTQKLVYARQA